MRSFASALPLALTCLSGINPCMAFTLRQLQYFVAVAEQGSITRAAQNLSISQSSITEAIKELETDLGVELFERPRLKTLPGMSE